MDDERDLLHPHLEETVRAIAELHADHDRRASKYERAIQALTERLTLPVTTLSLGVAIAIWIAANVVLERFGVRSFDPMPFSLLQGLLTLSALYMTVLILTSQRFDYRLAERRAQLTLQYVMVSEQKIAKLIELIEHQRRDNPQIADRHDEEAVAMSRPADGFRMAEAVDERHEEMLADTKSTTDAAEEI